MNKRFIRVAVFCALTATAAPVFVGCSDDYDADIAGLQDQINKINGVVGITGDDMAAAIDQVVAQMQTRIEELSAAVDGKVDVSELTAQVNTLNELIDQKADPSAIQAESEKLAGLIEQANKAAADANAADRQALEQQISSLEEKQNAAQESLNNALAGKVETSVLQSEAARLEALIAQAKEIAENAATPDQVSSQISALQGDIEAELAGKATTTALENLRTELSEIINGKITPAEVDQKVSAASEALEKAIDEAVAAIGEDLAAVDDALGNKVEASVFNLRMSQLEDELTALINAKADAEEINTKLAAIETQLAGKATPADLDALETALREAISSSIAASSESDAAATDAKIAAEIKKLNESLSTSIGAKVDTTTLATVQKELAALIEKKADASLIGGQIEALQKDLETVKSGKADQAVVNALTADVNANTKGLESAMNRLDALEELADQYGTAIKDLQDATADLQKLRDRISALENTELDLYTYAQFKALADRVGALEGKWGTPTDWSENVDDSLNKHYLAIEEISDKIDAFFNEQAGATAKEIYSRIGALELWKTQTVDNALQKLGKLDVSGLTDDQVADIAQMLTDISDLQSDLQTVSETLLNAETGEANFYNKEEIDTKFTNLETKIVNLFNTTLGDMIQSIVYVPFGNDKENASQYSSWGGLNFQSLILTAVSKTEPVAQTGATKIAFRVSPAAAAARIADEYEISLDGKQVKSANLPIEVTFGEPTVDVETGVITYPVKGNNLSMLENGASSMWVLCAKLQAKEPAVDGAKKADKFTEITSDYFTVGTSQLRVSDVHFVPANGVKDKDKIAYKASEGDIPAELNYGYKVEGAKFTGGGNNDLVATFGDLFEVTYEVSNETDFEISADGVLKAKENVASSVGKKGKVTATIFYKGNGTEVGDCPYKEVTICKTTYEFGNVVGSEWSLLNDFTPTNAEVPGGDCWWNGVREFTLKEAHIKEIIDRTDLTSDNFEALANSDGTIIKDKAGTEVGKIYKNADGDVTVRYYQNCFLTEAQTVELVLEPGYATEIHIFVKLPKMSLPVAPGDLTKVLGYWSGETANFNLHPIVDPTSGLISGLDCVADLTKFFTNYEDLVEIMDQSNSTIVWEWNDGSNSNEDGKDFFKEHASLDGRVHNLRQLKPEVIVTNDYDANEVTKEASFNIKAHFTALDGQDVSLSGDTPYNFTVTGVSSTWNKPTTPDLVFADFGQTLDLAKGCSWSIRTNVGEGLVWKDGKEYFGVKGKDEDKAATLTTTFGYGKLFGFEAPTFEIEKITVDGTDVSAEEYGNYVNPITEDYKLSISEEGKQRITPNTKVVITVRVKAYSRFEKGPISGTDYTFTVTAKGLNVTE